MIAPVIAALIPLVVAYETAADPVSFLVNYGVAGVVILLLVTGQLRTKSENIGLQKQLDERNADLREKDAALTALMTQISQHTLPQMSDLAKVIEALPKNLTGPSAKEVALTEADLMGRMQALAATLDAIERRSGGRT